MNNSEDIGLRERKRLATQKAIEEAAVSVTLERGHEGATVDAICKAANVSLRTFFNYFPSKDSAILGKWKEITEPRILELLESYPSSTLQGIMAVYEESSPLLDTEPSLLIRRHEIVCKNPLLMHLRMATLFEFERDLAGIIANRLRKNPQLRRLDQSVTEDEEARLTISTISIAIRHAIDMWMNSEPDTPMNPQSIKETVEQMARIIQEEQQAYGSNKRGTH